MRCPKCRYISFDGGERCRNCGYDFSLTIDVEAPDLPIQTGDEAAGPLADLQLGDVDASAPSRHPASAPPQAPTLDVVASGATNHARPIGATALDLPLFSSRGEDDDRPLVAPPAVPRAPLAVRRGSPAIARPRLRAEPEPEEPGLALEPPDDEPAASRDVATPRELQVSETAALPAASDHATASLARRLFAGLIDAAIILGIDAAIVYFTLQFCGLRLAEITVLPPVPFLTFVLLLNGGYFSSFVAAGGQTIGKMAAGIRVIPHTSDGGMRVPFGYAVLRAAAYLVSVLPAGIGLLPALFSADRRTLHDRLAETRVVRS